MTDARDHHIRFHTGRDDFPYYAHRDLITALEVALELNRPLLLTGDPGCGKTDFAWAAAVSLGHSGAERVHACHIHSDSRARDLLYSYDGLRRLTDVQAAAYDKHAARRAGHPGRYVALQGLGLAMCAAAAGATRPVVLLDEIDKAPRDLPNDLLRELDRGGFSIPELAGHDPLPDREKGEEGEEKKVRPYALAAEMPLVATEMPLVATSSTRPLVVITSNTERQLPDPFLRRCIFFHLEFPDEAALDRILSDHFARRSPAPAVEEQKAITTVFLALRNHEPKLEKKPATSELIDWALTLARRPDDLARVRDLAAGATLDWHEVPAICCLVKLKDDRGRLGLLSEAH